MKIVPDIFFLSNAVACMEAIVFVVKKEKVSGTISLLLPKQSSVCCMNKGVHE